jgi:hypothetical protein
MLEKQGKESGLLLKDGFQGDFQSVEPLSKLRKDHPGAPRPMPTTLSYTPLS